MGVIVGLGAIDFSEGGGSRTWEIWRILTRENVGAFLFDHVLTRQD
jgi:hypothetical protein